MDADPRVFWRGFLKGIKDGRSLAVFDPSWPEDWKNRLRKHVTGHRGRPGTTSILIPTSGSSGIPKFCRHDLETLTAAATGFAECFGRPGLINAVCLLRCQHIGGIMPVFRAAVMNGGCHFADYQDPPSLDGAPFPLESSVLSLVPTQLGRMLAQSAMIPLLKQFGAILVGGAACPARILETARDLGLRIAPSYGATETAAMVTCLDPEAFLSGQSGVGKALPHAQVELDTDGRILVQARSNLRNYLPESPAFAREPLATSDLGRFDTNGNLHILGRFDRMIISGGKNIHLEAVEEALLATGLVEAVHCQAIADPDWGHRLEAWIVPTGDSPPSPDSLITALRAFLPPYALPKKFHVSKQIPPKAPGTSPPPA